MSLAGALIDECELAEAPPDGVPGRGTVTKTRVNAQRRAMLCAERLARPALKT